jgi:hypothetical protein
MKIDQFAIAVLVFSAVIVSGLLIVDDINLGYAEMNVNISTDNFANMDDESEELYNYSAKVYDNIAQSETSIEALLTAAYEGLRLSVIPFKIVGGYIEAVALQLPIPTELVSFLVGAIAILFAFAVIYLIFRFVPFG